MKYTCMATGAAITVSDEEQDFCRKYELPLSVHAPFVRLRSLLAYRNRSNLYNSTCALTKKPILSCIPPERNLQVIDIDVWESDEWDPRDYGRPYDFSRPFFEQFANLYSSVPLPNLSVMRGTMENSDYTHGITCAKNCYLVFSSSFNEDCMFSKFLVRCKDMVDCLNCVSCEICYECRNTFNCYSLLCSDNCYNCADSFFLDNCQSCRACYGCVNLSNKQYHFFNEPLTKEWYQARVAGIDLGSYASLVHEKAKFESFRKQFPRKFMYGKNNQNGVGNFLTNTKNCIDSFFLTDCEDMQYCVWVNKGKSSFFHCMYGNSSELIYNSVSTGDSAYNVKFSAECWQSPRDLEYCIYCCYGAACCFGCVGIKKQSYYILNKQYSREEYSAMLPRIKEHMRSTGEYGKFFPPGLSPYYFNHTEAFYFLALPREEALACGYRWNDEWHPHEASRYSIPDNICDVQDDVLQQTLYCGHSGRKYRITKSELDFYRSKHLPLPRISPFDRVRENSSCMAIESLNNSNCANCGVEFITMYGHDRSTLLCETCYQQLVF